MKRHLLYLSAALLFAAGSASASAHWTLQSKDYTVDTLFHAKIGPGTTQTSLHLTGGSNLKVFYITTDLTNPYVDIRVAQAGSKLTGGAKLSAMSNANTNTSAGIEYFAGVNADFFGGSQPIGASVVNGQVYKAPGTASWINWYMNDSKVPGIEQLQFTGTATAGEASHRVSAINDGRSTDYLVIYNDHYAATTGTNAYGTEVVVSCDENISFNGQYTCTVEAAPVAGVGSMTIPAGKYILSGHGTAAEFLIGLKVGDKVSLDLNTVLATGGKVTQMAGGMPIILQNGETLNTQTALDHLTALNPRTAVGYSADRTKLVLLVVDGRGQGGSVGVVSKVLADIMRNVGCSDAMNFDGGGSSELYTRPFGIRNSPSDGTERTVVNSVWAVSVAPVDNEVAELCFNEPSISLPKYCYYTPTFYAYNKYDVIISTDLKGVELSCDPELGVIVNGNQLYANGEGTHKLYATYNGVTTEMIVTIGSAQPHTRLESVIVDGYRPYKAEIVAEVEGTDMKVDNEAFVWTTSDPAVVEVDALGVINGVKTGTAVVTASVDNFSVDLPVTVQKPASRYLELLGTDIDNLTVAKSGLSSATVSLASQGIAVDYKISSTRSTNFSIKPTETAVMYALPDSIRLVVNPGAGQITKIQIDAGSVGSRGVSVVNDVTLAQNQNNIISFPISAFCDTDDFASYPLSFNKISFYVGGKTGDEAHIEIPSLASVHAAVQQTDGIENIRPDVDSAASTRSYVVGRGEVIELQADGTWTVYNMSGAVVAGGRGRCVDTALLSAGNYIIATGAGSARLIVR